MFSSLTKTRTIGRSPNLDGEGGSAGHVSGVERPVCVERHGVHSEKEEGNADKQGELAQQGNTMLVSLFLAHPARSGPTGAGPPLKLTSSPPPADKTPHRGTCCKF